MTATTAHVCAEQLTVHIQEQPRRMEQGGRVRSGLLAAQVFRRLVVRGHAGSAVG